MSPNEQFKRLFVAMLHETFEEVRIAHSLQSMRIKDTTQASQERFELCAGHDVGSPVFPHLTV